MSVSGISMVLLSVVLVLMFETVIVLQPSVLIDKSGSSNSKRKPPATVNVKKHARKLTQQVIGTWISAPAKDSFLKPPVIVEHSPKLAVAQIGGNVTLFCRWSANPRANVSWHRGRLSNIDAIMTNEKMNINLVKANLSRWIQKKGPVPRSSQLLLTNFQISDTDMYSCRVTNSLGTATQTVAVIRKGDILFTRIPKNQTVLENHSSVLFDCHAVSDESIISYTWQKDGRDVRSYPDLQRRFKIFSNGSLHLLDVRYQDRGIYTCKPETLSSYSQFPSYGTQMKDNRVKLFPYDSTGRLRHASAHLFVHFIPRISTAGPRVIYLGLSGPGRLPCTLEASPSVHTIEWRRLFADHQTTSFYSANASKRKHTAIWWKQFVADELNSKRQQNGIKVTYWHEWASVTPKDAGQYQCRGQNAIGWSEWSTTLDIITKEFPRLISRPPRTKSVRKNEMVNLHCAARGDPKPTVQWFMEKKSHPTMNSNVTAFLGDTVPRITIGDVDEAEQILEQKPQAINHVRLSQNLPNSATVKLDGSLNLLVTQPEDVDGTFYCIASNIVGSVMSSVELLYEANDDERPKANRLQSMTVMIEGFQVQPQSFGVWISWKPNLNMDVINTDRVRILVEQGIISSQSTIADKNTTCYYVVYSRLVRTREKWRSVRVQPLAVHKLWLGGFIPDEAYAFKLARWCAADKPSARSPVVYQKTKPFISFAALEGRFHGTLESTDDQIPVVQTPSSLLPRPHSLHLLLPRALNHITSNWQSGELYTSDSTFLLRWKVGGTDSEQNAFSSILYHRVEYFLGFVDGTTTFHFPTTLVWLPNVTNSWHTLAPIRAPQKSFALITEQNDLSDVLSDSLSRVFISSMRLRFRVRSYGLLCVSEPSQELHIEEPLLGHVLPVLNRTVAREQLSLKVMSEHPNSVSSPTTHPVEHFGSVKFTLGISNRLWYTMSCSVLVCVLLCFIVLIAYRVYQMRCMRKTINVTVAEVNQSPCENNRLLINQLRLGLPGLPIYHQRPPEFTNTLTDLKQRVNKPVAEVEAYPELKQSIFSHKAYPIKPSLNLPLGWNNLNSLQCQNASSSKVASDKPASVGSQIGFASNCRNISCIVVHENESPKWTDSHTSHLGCTFTNVTDSSLVDNICQTHNIMHHAGMSGSQLRPISEVLCLDYTDEVQRNKLHSRSSNTNEVEERTEIQQTEQSNWTDFFDLSNHLPPTASPWNGTMCTVVPPSLVPQCSARGSSDAYTTCKSNYLILPLDLKSYPTQPSENVHLIAYVPCETNCLPLLDSTDPLISSVNTLPTERQIEPFIHKLTKQPAWKQNE